MKKNKMMRLASSLLVAVLLTTSVISGTFAKYVTSDEATDEARVAKWGVDVTVTKGEGNPGTGMFSEIYAAQDNETTITNTVVSDVNVLAPGTNGSLGKVTISGVPEVATEVRVTVDLDLGDKWKVNDNEYCPLVFTVDGKEIKITSTIENLEKEVEDEIAKVILEDTNAVTTNNVATKQYEVLESDFGDADEVDLEVTWSWPFGDSDLVSDETNVKDTALGDAAAENASNAATINFSCTVTVTQVD